MTVTATESGLRLDVFLSAYVGSRTAAERSIALGNCTVNGAVRPKSFKLSVGDTVQFSLLETPEISAEPENIPLDIVYEDDDLIVVNKPKGMVVHPAVGNYSGTLVNALLYHCRGALSSVGGEFRPGIVHRIDKDTSGLLVVAKNDIAHRALSEQLQNRTLSRTYECVIIGAFKDNFGVIDLPIGRSPNDRKKMAVVPNGRRAVTHWELLAKYSGYSHLRCKLETGRTHQIRVHLAHIGHALLGDKTYGKTPSVALATAPISRVMLHAERITLPHPVSGKILKIVAPLPPDFIELETFLKKNFGGKPVVKITDF